MTINHDKIRDNKLYLGTLPITVDSTEKRSACRKLLNGMGFKTEDYISLTMPILQEIYNDLLMDKPETLVKWVKGVTPEYAIQALDAFTGVSVEAIPTIEAIEHTTKEEITMPIPDTTKTEISPEAALNALMGMIKGNKGTVDESAVIAIVKREMKSFEKPLPVKIEIKRGEEKTEVEELHHFLLPSLIKAIATGCQVMLVGPAGSGKTTMAEMAAKALGVKFYFNGAISSEYKLTGFIDAQGRVVRTAYRDAYENGGLYLFDEIDASSSDSLLAFNTALANGHMDFPDGQIKRHKDFYCIAAANTFGRGADRQYVGRNQLDAASLDRFIVMEVDYDEKLEKVLACNDNWVDTVQKIRKFVFENKIRAVISPRASIYGAKLLGAGFSERDTLNMVVFKGLDADTVKKIKGVI